MKHLMHFGALFALAATRKSKRFVRLSPNRSGKIFIFDKRNKEIFHVHARENIDSVTADQIFAKNDYDLRFLKRYPEILDHYRYILSTGRNPLIIDCGANIGLSAYYFSREFPESRIVAVEPEVNNFTMIKKNCDGLGNIDFKNAAIGSVDGFATIDDSGSKNNAFRTSRTDSGKGAIPILSIDTILSENTDLVPFIVKIDIEGFEDDLFSRNTGWVAKVPLLIAETHDWMLPGQANSRNFLRAISNEDRDFVHRGENIFSISNDYPK
ncbi:hypothetical protein GCM10023219_28960 [Stakelama sediminis]|uniref:FkbM family methyltransferase n=1 Tax=Stakelama sediminis TaxID=463200 RepID=A0A840Z3S3_9SPHN|nr:FkbM family methyltransferase [Stakelama sediminis]MBB5720360.1 FkbM family methyltransferase [Stakelama sediminis]